MKEWQEVRARFASYPGVSCFWFALLLVLCMIPAFWPFLIIYCLPPLKRRVYKKNAKKTKKLIEEKYAGRDLHIRLEKRDKEGSKHKEYAAIITIDNPGVPVPGVELPPLSDENKMLVEKMRGGGQAEAPTAGEPSYDPMAYKQA